MSDSIQSSPQSSQPDCEILQELIPAYSIGATDAEETRLVESLLPLCPESAAELEEFRTLAGNMLYSAAPTVPPAHLHDKIMTAVGATLPLKVLPAAPRPVANRVWIAAAAAAVVLLVLSNVLWAAVNSDLRRSQDELAAQLNEQNALFEIVASGDTRQFTLVSSSDNAILAICLWSPVQQRAAILATTNLPSLAPDSIYQLWLIQSGENPVSAGIFESDGTLVFNPPQPLGAYDILAISVEPSGGSPLPTTDPIAVAEI
jgi:anti-sigma-K factor RskA